LQTKGKSCTIITNIKKLMLELYAMKVARTVLRGCFVVILNGASTDPKIAWGLFNKSEKLQGKL